MKNKGIQQTVIAAGLGIMMLLASFSSLQAAGTSAAQFLKLGAGARAAGMGDAFSSVANDVTATYWNPAGLAQIESPEMAVMHDSWLQNTQYQYLGMAMPRGNGALGFSLYRMDFGTIDRYTSADVKDGSYGASSLAANVTMSSKIGENLYTGVTAKYIQESIENEHGTSFAGDLGLLWKGERINLAAVLQNVGPGLKMVQETAPLPRIIRVGASSKLFNDRLLVGLDLAQPNDNKLGIHAGAEYQLGEMIKLRGGYSVTPGNNLDVSGLTGVTAGMGIMFNRFTIDYAISPFGDLGISQRVSLRFQFQPASR